MKRVRNPDAVALEVLDHFLSEARSEEVTVLLAGVRCDVLAALERMRIPDRHPRELIFPEEKTDFSETLDAVRAAQALASPTKGREARVGYYLV
ncbi:hypothetical+protein [Methylocapsa aurea]